MMLLSAVTKKLLEGISDIWVNVLHRNEHFKITMEEGVFIVRKDGQEIEFRTIKDVKRWANK